MPSWWHEHAPKGTDTQTVRPSYGIEGIREPGLESCTDWVVEPAVLRNDAAISGTARGAPIPSSVPSSSFSKREGPMAEIKAAPAGAVSRIATTDAVKIK